MSQTASIAALAEPRGLSSPTPLATDAVAPAAPIPETAACPECGGPIPERFCGRCGERRPEPGGLRLGQLAADLVEQLTSLDFRIVRTLWALLRRPGSLTRGFVAGRRARYTRPLTLYVLVSGAFFLATPHLPLRNLSPEKLILRTRGQGSQDIFSRIAAKNGETIAQFAEHVGRSPLVQPRLVSAYIVPVLATLLTVLLAGRRRLLAEHVLLATHLQTFLLILAAGVGVGVLAGGWISAKLFRTSGPASDLELAIGIGGVLLAGATLLVGHLYSALRRVYGLGGAAAAWRAVALAAAAPVAVSVTQSLVVIAVAATHRH
jgi:hypothetical protein